MTKEEILNNEIKDEPFYLSENLEPHIYKAMEIYAKQYRQEQVTLVYLLLANVLLIVITQYMKMVLRIARNIWNAMTGLKCLLTLNVTVVAVIE